ncbi:MAG: sulfatase-like hydrolase/transferase, partial [Deltaproteobacteria bacterium]|nr:sulfatase-like hydrolase/transferase [Deltaproteobacteria bacterium]
MHLRPPIPSPPAQAHACYELNLGRFAQKTIPQRRPSSYALTTRPTRTKGAHMTKATALFLMLGLVVSCRSGETDAAPAEAETPKPDVAKPATSPEGLDRTVLPIPQPTYPAATELDARNAKAPPPFEIKAPEGAPNVVIVLIDDIGFGTASSFGGPIATPTLDSLAEGGLRYNQFHTTALCSPTRMALLTGRNHHSANTGSVQEVA